MAETAPYQLFGPLSPDEYEALKADIAARGVMVPIEIDAATDEPLDGHHRLTICRELGITNYPRVVRRFDSEADKRAHVRALNLLRRHLTQDERAAVLRAQLEETPGRSNLSIAKQFGVSHTTVGKVRDSLGDVANVATRTDTRGRKQPARKPRASKPAGGILATTPAEARAAVKAAATVEPDGLITAPQAERQAARQHQADQAAERQAALDALDTLDVEGRLPILRAMEQFHRGLSRISIELVPLSVETIARELSEDDWHYVIGREEALVAWFAALSAARPRRLALVQERAQ